MHGALSGREPHVDQLIPLFSLSKTNLHSDVLGVPTEQWTEDFEILDWHHRTEERLLWRGSNTGAYYSEETMWRMSHRARLVRMASVTDEAEKLTMLPPPKERGSMKENTEEVSWSEANDQWMDIAFTDQPIRKFCSFPDFPFAHFSTYSRYPKGDRQG